MNPGAPAAAPRGAASPAGRIALSVLLALSILGGARISAVTWLQLHNTPHHNGNWESRKIGLAFPVMGSAATMMSRTMTAENQLNLATWFGFQDLQWRDPLPLAQLQLRARYTEDRYLNVWFGGDDDSRVGVRLSKHDRLPNAWWVEGPDGLFSEVHEFTPAETRDLSDVTIDFPGDGEFVFSLNGHEVIRATAPIAEPGTFGFKGAQDDTWVDDVRIVTRDGRVFEDDFANHHGEAAAHAVALLAFLLVPALASRLRRASTPALFPALAASLVMTLSATLAWQADTRWSWPLYPDEDDIDYGPYPQSSMGESDVIDGMIEQFGDHPGPPGGRILFLGTSQTHGSGASSVAHTWVQRVCDGLNEAVPASPPAFECMNTGLPGSQMPVLWKLYRDHWSRHEPDLVVANLGNNDGVLDELDEALRKLVAFNQKRGIATWFVLEPTTSDMGPFHNGGKHDVLRAVAEEMGLEPPCELQAHMFEQRGRGHLWWDFVHATDGGQLIMSEKVLSDLLPIATAVRERALAELDGSESGEPSPGGE